MKAARRRSPTTRSKSAFPPRVEPVGDVQQVIDGKADLEFRVLVDLMPDFELADVSKLEVERLVAEVTDEDVDDAIKRLAEQSRSYSPRGRRRGRRRRATPW